MFKLICDKCKTEVKITNENVESVLSANEDIDIIVYNSNIQIFCLNCKNSVKNKEGLLTC